jgi:sulfatase maturation enzyme AslB (radical SAM superfamily)
MNILLTSKCNRRCPYCFAAERISHDSGASAENAATTADNSTGAAPPTFISARNFEYALSFVTPERRKVVGILGGEPSLHPRFVDLLDIAWKKGVRTKIFTNGLWAKEKINAIRKKAPQLGPLLHMVVNVNHPDDTPSAERKQQARFLEALGPWCALSYNIYKADFDPLFLLDLIDEHKTKKEIRIAIAQPLANTENICVDLEDYPQMAPTIVDLVEKGDAQSVRVSFDCGFIMCMFTPAQIGKMIMCSTHFVIRCAPVIDVGTDLSVWACFPLSTIGAGVRLTDFENLPALRTHFRSVFSRLYETGAMEKCVDCIHRKRDRCPGGCAAHVYRRLNP